MHLQNEFKLIKTSKCDIIQAYIINIWEMIIYLFTSETLQHIGTHINQNVYITMYIVISIHWIPWRLLILSHLKAGKLHSLKLFHNSHESHRKQKVVNPTTPLSLVAPYAVILKTHCATSDDQVAKTTTLRFQCHSYISITTYRLNSTVRRNSEGIRHYG